MKFKLDENLPLEAATLLRQAGFDASIQKALRSIIPVLRTEPLDKHLWIVDERQVRIRE